jgi:glycosyltransferase involved in cell wall biosynthesis
MSKKKLLIISDSPTLTTGLGRICREIATRLFDKYDLAVAGWHQQPVKHQFPFFIYPFTKTLAFETENQLRSIVQDFSPDIVLCIGDIWDFIPASRVFAQCRDVNENFKAILWVTVDGEWIELSWSDILRQFDSVASMSQFGVKEIKKISPRFKDIVIYPGLDKNTFKSLNANLNVKEINLDINNTFTILNIGQNCDRKNIPATIDAFAEFQKNKKDTFLFLGTDPESSTGHNLWAIIKRNKLERNVTVVKNIKPIQGIEDNRLNLLYNICKVNINSSIGEGLCLPILEGMSSGCIPIVTDYAATPELVEKCGLKIKVSEFIYGAYGVVRAVISKKDLIEKLEILYSDWKKYKDLPNKEDSLYFSLKDKCKKEVSKYTWEETVKQISELIEDTCENKKNREFLKSSIKIEDLKLLMVIPSWGKNCGIAEYTKQLGESMEKNGTKVSIYSNNNLKDLIPHLSKFNCIYIQHEYSFFQNRTDLEEFLDKARESKVKTVILMHTFAPLYPYLNMVIDKADAVIFHNETFKKFAMKQRIDAKNVHVVSMGCYAKFIEDNTEIKNKLNISDKYPIIGSFGFLRDQKGYNELVLAVKAMKEKYPNILCLIVAPPHEFGSKSYDETFFRFIEDEQMQSNVLLIREYLDDAKLLKTLNACDLFVLNYKDNPTMGGNSAACKTLLRLCKPIIVPNGIAFLDMQDEVYKVNNLNKQLIIQSVDKILENKELQNKISQNAEAFLNKNDWLNVAKSHLAICKE